MSFADGEVEYVRKKLYAYNYTQKSRFAVVLTSKLAPTTTNQLSYVEQALQSFYLYSLYNVYRRCKYRLYFIVEKYRRFRRGELGRISA